MRTHKSDGQTSSGAQVFKLNYGTEKSAETRFMFENMLHLLFH